MMHGTVSYAVILAIVVVVTLCATADLIAAIHNALAARSVMHGSVSYTAHHYTRTCGFKAFTQGKCFPRL